MARERIRIERAGQGAFPLAELRERPPPPVPWLRIVLAGLLGLGLLGAAGIGLTRLLIDTEALHEEALAALRQATGREVTIGGKLRIESIANAVVVVEDVVIPTRAGFDGPPLARIGRLEAELSRASLLGGRVTINRLVISEPEFHLAIDAQGQANWRNPPAAPGAATGRPRSLPASLHLKDGRLTFADARAGRSTTLALRRATLAEAQGGGLMAVNADLGYGTQRISANGQVGPLARLVDPAPTSAWPLRMTLEMPGAKLTVAGGIDRPLELAGYAVKVDAWVSDTANLAGVVPYRLPVMRTVSLTARLADTGGSIPDIAGARLQVGASDLSVWVPGLKIDSADIVMPGLEQALRGEVLGTLNNVPVRLRAALGGLAVFLPEKASEAVFFPVDVEAEAGGTRVGLKGGIAAMGARRGLDLALSARISDLDALSPLVGQRLPRLRNLTAEVKLADSGGGFGERIALRDLAIGSPLGDLAGDLVLHLGQRGGLSGRLRSTKLDADALVGVLEAAFGPIDLTEQPSPFRRRAWDDRRVIPNRRLHLEALRAGDADLVLALDELVAVGATWRNVAGRVRLDGGRLTIDPLVAELPRGRASLSLAVDASIPRTPMRLQAAIPGIPVQALLASAVRRDNLFGLLEIDADLSAEGETIRALADTVSGRLGLSIVEGDIDSRLLLEPLGRVLAAARVPTNLATQMGTLARLRCFAGRLDAEGGRAEIGALVLESGRVLIVGDGNVDLAREQMSVRLRSTVRGQTAGVNVPVRVQGSLADLQLALEEGPARPIPMGELPDPCPGALELSRAGRQGVMPSDAAARPILVPPPAPARR